MQSWFSHRVATGSAGVAYTLQVVGQRWCRCRARGRIMSLESFFSAVGGALLPAKS